eukprot:symbB.v1.2.033650.t1/scaffold4199.1/size43160/5
MGDSATGDASKAEAPPTAEIATEEAPKGEDAAETEAWQHGRFYWDQTANSNGLIFLIWCTKHKEPPLRTPREIARPRSSFEFEP